MTDSIVPIIQINKLTDSYSEWLPSSWWTQQSDSSQKGGIQWVTLSHWLDTATKTEY